MTRGNFVLITDEGVFASIQFNGDMYPSYNGRYVYNILKKVETFEEFKAAIKRFNEKRFRYGEEEVNTLERYSNLDFSDDYYGRYNSDYLYIKNISSSEYVITPRTKKATRSIKPNEIQIWNFGYFIDVASLQAELKVTQAEMERLGLVDKELSEARIEALRNGKSTAENGNELFALFSEGNTLCRSLAEDEILILKKLLLQS